MINSCEKEKRWCLGGTSASPYVFSFNKDATDEDGIAAPVTAYSKKADTLDAVFEAYADGIAK